jgi:hypothetical protein
MSDVLSDPLTVAPFKDQAPGLFGPNIPGHYNLCGSCPCRHGKVFNLTYVHPSTLEKMRKEESWNSIATLEDVKKITADFHPVIQVLPRKATDIKSYNIMVREEIPTFVKGRALILGNAARPILTCTYFSR